MGKIKSLFQNAIFKNSSWLIGGKILQMVIGLLVSILTARYLGPSNFGLINYAMAYTVFFAAFCTLGINSVIVKELVENPEKDGTILGTAMGLRALSSFLSAIMIIGIVAIVDRDEPLTIAVVALCSVGMIFQIFETFNYWFQAQLKSKNTAIAVFIAYMLTAVYKIVLLILEKPVNYFAFATSVDYIAAAILLIIFYKANKGSSLHFSWEYGKKMLAKSSPFILTGLMVAIYGQTDRIMLKQMLSETETGYYATAVNLCTMWCFVLGAIIDSMTPSIMESHKNDDGLFEKKNKNLYRIVFYISMFVSVCFVIFAELAIKILYGDAYLPAANPLRVITWYTAFSYLGVARDIWIVCKNRQKSLKYIYVSAAIINVVLNFIFIPLWGATGAAVASLAAQVLTSIIIPFFIKGLRENAVMMVKAICFK